jgi:hypothetical protein
MVLGNVGMCLCLAINANSADIQWGDKKYLFPPPSPNPEESKL